MAAPVRIKTAIQALAPFWARVPVDDVTAALCRRYAGGRRAAPATVRRELGTLRAALRYCETEGYITRAPNIVLPSSPPPRDRWLTEAEAARLLREARSVPHLGRFVLLGLYTGTRKTALLNLSWTPQINGGWIDVEAGLMYRQGPGDQRTKKRQPPIRLPRKLLAHCRRWRQDGSRWVVHFRGQRVHDIARAWNAARDRAGLPGVVPHSLRHTAITWSCQRGVPLYEVAGYFGVTQAVIESVYAHHHPSFLAAASEAMNRRK